MPALLSRCRPSGQLPSGPVCASPQRHEAQHQIREGNSGGEQDDKLALMRDEIFGPMHCKRFFCRAGSACSHSCGPPSAGWLIACSGC